MATTVANLGVKISYVALVSRARLHFQGSLARETSVAIVSFVCITVEPEILIIFHPIVLVSQWEDQVWNANIL